MRLRNLLGIALGFRLLIGCHGAVEPRPPIARVCAANRIGQVIVEGAPRSSVAPLVVLEGTLDDRPRTERIAKIAAEGLRARGFLNAEIAISREAGCGTDLVAEITLGPKVRIARIRPPTVAYVPSRSPISTRGRVVSSEPAARRSPACARAASWTIRTAGSRSETPVRCADRTLVPQQTAVR